MRTLIHVLCAALAFVAVDVWKAPAAFALQQIKKAGQWVSKAKKKHRGVPRRANRQEHVRQEALELVRTHSQTLWGIMADNSMVPSTVPPVAAVETEEPLEGEDPEELLREDDVPVDIETFRRLWLAYMEGITDEDRLPTGLSKRQLVDFILEWLGTPYRFGGTTSAGIDCSGFIRRLFADVAGVMLPRTAAAQYMLGEPIPREQLQFGDLLFFHTRRHAYVSHVGIYLGDNLFAHASSRGGVTISSLQSTYYSKRFIGARRLTERTLLRLAAAQRTVPTSEEMEVSN